MNILTVVLASVALKEILVGFLVILVVLAIIYGLLWAIENWISPIPPPVKMVLAIILLILVIIWAIDLIKT